MNGMMLLPAAPGTCPLCATAHEPHFPHNAQSLFYGMRFKMEHGRDATWADAVAHCVAEMKAFWKGHLEALGNWSEPPEGVAPIAEPCDKESPVVVSSHRPLTTVF